MTTEFVTSVGRIVWGNPGRSVKKTDQKTKQPILRDGQQVEQWAFGVAFPTAEFQQSVMPYLQQAAATIFPQGTPPQFSWKIKDGDGVDAKGKPYNTREGYAGHQVLTVSTEAFAPPIYKNEGGKYRQMDGSEIKCGDYIVVKLNVKANQPTDPTHTPGLYVNPEAIEHVGFGAEIVSNSTNPDEVFGGATYNLPPGASATPVAPVAAAAAPYTAQPVGNVPAAAPLPAPVSTAPANPVQPQPYAAPVNPAQPTAAPLPAPATDFVANAGVPAAPMAPQPAPAVPMAPAAVPGVPPGR